MYKESVSAVISQTADIAPVVLMPGDPLRAKYIAENFLENTVCFNTVRGMLGYTGSYKGKTVSVMGSGMGIPSFALYATELYTQFDVEAIIRVGTTGAIADGVNLRDIIIAEASSSDSSFGDYLDFPGKLAAAASFDLLYAAVRTAEELKLDTRVGNVFCSDFFYHPDRECNEKLKRFGILGVDMESAGLYWVASQCGKKALAMLTVSNHLFTGEGLTSEERQNSFNDMIRLALETTLKI